jgi:hypothetical protein
VGARWKVLVGLAALAGLVLVGLMLARPVGKGSGTGSQPQAFEAGPETPVETDRQPSLPQPGQTASSAVLTHGQPASVTAESANIITNWEDQVDQILAAEGTVEAKAKQMLELFPRLPEAGQVEVAKHLSNLVSDQDYAPLGQLLADPRLPQEVLETLMADVLNRPNSLKLPALLEVARTAQHPKATDAKGVLGFFLEADYGDDWPKWQEKIQQWLKDNPD